MPYKSNNTNKQSSENTGNPTGQGKGDLKDVNAAESLDALHDDLSEKYTDDNGEPNIGGVNTGSHPNRNTNKPNIDKPRYS